MSIARQSTLLRDAQARGARIVMIAILVTAPIAPIIALLRDSGALVFAGAAVVLTVATWLMSLQGGE